MTALRLLLPIAALALAGCGTTHHEGNYNNGISKRLNFKPVPANAPLGVRFTVEVSHALEGTFECQNSVELDVRQDLLPGPRSDCRFVGTRRAVVKIVSADCGGACTAALDTPRNVAPGVIVTPLVAGDTVLKVTAILDDGTVREDSVALTFSVYEPLLLECAAAYNCPGPHAIFVGASFDWIARSMSSASVPAQYQEVEITELDPAGVVALESSGINFSEVKVRALKPGVAVIHFRDRSGGRDYEMTRQVRVVGIDEALRGEARLRAGGPGREGYQRADADLVGGPVPAIIGTEVPQLVLTWVLADGARALGGAGRVSSPDRHVVSVSRILPASWLPEIGAPRFPEDLSHTLFYFEGAPGQVGLTASLGNARLELSVDHQYQPPPLPACPARSGSTNDLTQYENVDQFRWSSKGSIKVLTTQLVQFDFRYFSPDAVIAQRCGPARVIAGPQSNDFDAELSAAGDYQFTIKGWGAEVVGELIEVQAVP